MQTASKTKQVWDPYAFTFTGPQKVKFIILILLYMNRLLYISPRTYINIAMVISER